ncbi:MAG: hypothetical protein ACD_81C00141G0003 [uncultured bacterium]|uniref:Uncharacterized protein n=2 Tax=Candidatus Wolfeibacteriota TaxID=1752735 RepID=A0A0G1H778_9BACT|nr:MAG: hypothetical protein ACD_81C00141G0003 [uncultured bacterium]KKR12323.1 MAG: hypothetical protein UT41_C0002G0097 [Candidatus Wolfebacteria bacterium GW2011_GWC2_39_22]KKT43231.1 MAG: hypothetical protein UW32_C0002G0092 [Candidatus Wolfebacteria bacterium GW2011_GWE2_44_13]HBI25953.1 hypothetical protein [Candidatus Wolfebacteria bacterium]
MAGKIIIIGTGQMVSPTPTPQAACSVIAVWFYTGIQIVLKCDSFLFLFEHPYGGRRIESGYRRRAHYENDPKLIGVGEILLPITGIRMAYVRADGIVAICDNREGASAAVGEVAESLRALFKIGVGDDIIIDEVGYTALTHFFKVM